MLLINILMILTYVMLLLLGCILTFLPSYHNKKLRKTSKELGLNEDVTERTIALIDKSERRSRISGIFVIVITILSSMIFYIGNL